MRTLLLCLVVACKSSPSPAPPDKPEPPVAKPDDSNAIQYPEVVPAGYDPADRVEPSLVVTLHGIVGNGQPIVSLTDGITNGEDKEGGTLGIKITRLTDWLAKSPGDGKRPLVIALDKRVPYRTLIEVLFSSKQKEAGYKRFCIMAHAGAKTVMVPLELPEKLPPSGATTGIPPLGLVVSVTKTKALLWSISGMEGTLKNPKLEVPLGTTTAAGLRRALDEIATRRFGTGDRAPDDRAILLQCDGAVTMQVVAELLGAVREANGKELFPDVRLSSGFE